jgi:hypothetical protein
MDLAIAALHVLMLQPAMAAKYYPANQSEAVVNLQQAGILVRACGQSRRRPSPSLAFEGRYRAGWRGLSLLPHIASHP